MKPRLVGIGLLAVVSLAGLVGVAVQHHQLDGLRAQLRGQVSGIAPAPEPVEDTAGAATAGGDSTPVSTELLRLRNEVTRLKGRVGKLAVVRMENEQLEAQIARGNTNPNGGVILRRLARMAGYDSPQDTLQSLLWSIQQKDSNAFLQAWTPSCAQRYEQQMGQGSQSAEQLFRNFDSFVGFAVVGSRQLPNGLEAVEVQIAPGTPPERLVFEQVDGQWKLTGPL